MSTSQLNKDSVDPPEYETEFLKAKSKQSIAESAAQPPAETPVDPAPSKRKCCCILTVVLVVLLVLLLLGLGYYFFLRPATEADQKKEDGNAPEGKDSEYDIKAAKEIKAIMNASVDPCIDFYNYACGGWMSSPSVINSTRILSRVHSYFMKSLLKYKDVMEKPIRDSDPMFKVQPRKFFAACSNKERRKQRDNSPFYDVMKKVGKFPLLVEKWEDGDFYMPGMLARLTKLDLHPLFNLSLDTTGNVATFQMSRPNRTHNWEDDRYFSWARQVLQLLAPALDKDEIEQAVTDAKRIYNYIYNEDLSNSDSFHPKMDEKMFIKELVTIMPGFDWKKYFEIVTAGTSANYVYDKTLVTVKVPTQFMDMFNTIIVREYTHEKRTLANYLMMSLLPFASNLPGYPPYERKNKIVVSMHFDECYEETLENFPDQVNRMFHDEAYNTSLIPLMHDIVKELKTALWTGIEQVSWLDAKIKQRLKYYLDRAQDVEFPEILANDSYLNNMYERVPIKDYFEFYVGKSAHRFNETLNKVGYLVKPEPEYARYMLNSLDLAFQMIDPNMKSSVIFGTAGTFKTTFMTSELLAKLDMFTGLNEFNKIKQCFNIHYTDVVVDGVPIPKPKGIHSHILSSLAIDKAFEAYNNYRKNKTEERPLPGLDLTHDQLFFLSYAQMWCTFNPFKQNSTTKSETEERIQGEMENSLDFSKVYGCKSGTPMNTGIKCKMF